MTGTDNTLLILIPGFPESEADSTCLPFPQAFLKNMKQAYPSINIIVLAFQYPFEKRTYQWNGIQVHAFNGRNRAKAARLALWFRIWRRMEKLFRQHHVIGILNFWCGECALLGTRAGSKHSVRSLTWLMGQDARKKNRYIPWIKPSSTSLIALSDFLAEEFFRNHSLRPAHIIAPGIDVSAFPQMNQDRKIDVMGAGSLTSLKQYEQFVRVVGKLRSIHPNIRTVICGDGPEKERLERLIAALGLTDNITLLGETDHETVLKLMCASRVFLHPSAYEGFGMVCMEALFAGAHVVSYCQPMHAVSPHHHVVRSPNEMAEKITSLLCDEALNHRSVLMWPIQTVCNRVMALYEVVNI